MTQEESATPLQGEQLSEENMLEQGCNALEAPFFQVTDRVTFKPMMTAPKQGTWNLPPGVARLVCMMSLGTALLWPLSGCSSSADVPCPVPTSNSSGTPVPNGTPVTCTTSRGGHYVWVPSRGGWVSSKDGVHPDPNARGVGVDESSGGASDHNGANDGHSGVGDGHAGGGHGGGDGG